MRCKVLVVDDEHDIADLLEVYLQNEDYIVPESVKLSYFFTGTA